MNEKVEELLERIKVNELADKKIQKKVLWILAIVGGAALLAGLIYFIVKLVTMDCEDDDDFDDDYDSYLDKEAAKSDDGIFEEESEK